MSLVKNELVELVKKDDNGGSFFFAVQVGFCLLMSLRSRLVVDQEGKQGGMGAVKLSQVGGDTSTSTARPCTCRSKKSTPCGPCPCLRRRCEWGSSQRDRCSCFRRQRKWYGQRQSCRFPPGLISQ